MSQISTPTDNTNTESLKQKVNSSTLKSFSIKKLFGYKNVNLEFDKAATLLIAENGAGKTTILNIIYYSLNCRFEKLIQIDFQEIEIKFRSGASVIIKKNMLKKANFQPAISNSLKTRIIHVITHGLEDYDPGDSLEEEIIQKQKATIRKNIGQTILYFPTYRRIEEELSNLGYQDGVADFVSNIPEGLLIKFGMSDVEKKIEELTDNIKSSALDLFQKATGAMLSQLVEDEPITSEMRKNIDFETLNIVLGRIGENNIPKKAEIEKLIQSGHLYEDSGKYDKLVYLLAKILELYEQQIAVEASIKKFVEICNQYLIDKKVIYDEKTVIIYIIDRRKKKEIKIGDLSSGEKQIISLFSKIFLETDEDFILLFDEPELSLSIEWQRLLLPHILSSERCKMMLAVTHSPFIFDNELDELAQDLDVFVDEEY